MSKKEIILRDVKLRFTNIFKMTITGPDQKNVDDPINDIILSSEQVYYIIGR